MAGKEFPSVVFLDDSSSLNIVRKCGPALSDVLQSKFGCVAIIEGVDFEKDTASSPKRPTVVPEQRLSVKLNAGVKVSVWKADLSVFKVDAVVNAANSSLQHYGGLALALSTAGGPQIQRESDDYIGKNGPLKTGDAIVSDAGRLQCNKIIHAVGPHLPTNYTKFEFSLAERLLETAIRSILDRVKENHLKTVAIPAISSGLFNYPLPQCATTIVSTVKNYYDNYWSYHRGHRPDEILLVNHDEPTVKEMERACSQVLRPNFTYSQAAAAAPASTVQVGKVLVTLKRGKIEEQQTEIIVNTTSSNRDLNGGVISRALLDKAGYGLQKEINNAFIHGRVIITRGYKLKCQEVYHTFCPVNQSKDAQQMLWSSVLDCLGLAGAKHHKSIAFPAIGTGALGFDKKEVAQIMTQAVAQFAQTYPEKMDVHFVIFPSDNDTFKAFEEQMRFLQQKSSDPNVTQAFQHSGASPLKPPSPQISLSGASEEAVREAKRWLCGIFLSSGTFTIRNNFIQHMGEQEYKQLSRLTRGGVLIEEFFDKGHAYMTVQGGSSEDVAVAVMQVEAMLCYIQQEFIKEEEDTILLMVSGVNSVSFQRKKGELYTPVMADRAPYFRNVGLEMVKVEEVENPTLKMLFDLKKNQLQCFNPKVMYQRIPAQFCEMVCRVGFHSACAPPADPAHGEGIYFTSTVREAMDVWRGQSEEYLYFVEAEVLTGMSTSGAPGLILPPAMDTNPQTVYDSVKGRRGIAVIFSGYQALPKYIFTCKVKK